MEEGGGAPGFLQRRVGLFLFLSARGQTVTGSFPRSRLIVHRAHHARAGRDTTAGHKHAWGRALAAHRLAPDVPPASLRRSGTKRWGKDGGKQVEMVDKRLRTKAGRGHDQDFPLRITLASPRLAL